MAEINRLTLRIPSDLHELVKYWSKKNNVSINDYLLRAIEHMIKYENKDYDLPVAEVQRLNQLIDLIENLSFNVSNLEKVTVSGFDSLLTLVHGDNDYLVDIDMED